MKELENTINLISGKKTEITIINEKMFSICFEGESRSAVEKIKKYFSSINELKSIEFDYDEECDHTAIYLNLK